MAKQINRNVYFAINGTAYQDHASNVSVSDEAEKIDITSFSANGYREFAPGLKDAEITVNFFQDYAAASIHAVLQPYYTNNGTFTITVRPDAGSAASATNPVGTMVARLYSYGGIDGEVGSASEIEAVFANAGTAGLTWGTA